MNLQQRRRVELLVAALRSGEYAQTKGVLHKEGVGYCCMGVACDLSKLGRWEERDNSLTPPDLAYIMPEYEYSSNAVMPEPVFNWYGFDNSNPDLLGTPRTRDGEGHCFSSMNDCFDLTFPQIADMIEWYYLSDEAPPALSDAVIKAASNLTVAANRLSHQARRVAKAVSAFVITCDPKLNPDMTAAEFREVDDNLASEQTVMDSVLEEFKKANYALGEAE